MNWRFINLVCFVFLVSCGEFRSCEVDPIFEEKYFYHYNFVKDNYKRNQVIGGQMIRSIYFLSEISGLQSKVAFGDVTTYDSYSDYKNDMEKWKRWYAKNKCKVLGTYADSLESTVIQSTKWIDGPVSDY